ncbi:ubiquinone anaerobic biosynthesis accessory factor UbiT [Azospirillum doebereinerae]
MPTPRSDDTTTNAPDGRALETAVTALALRVADAAGPRLRDPLLDRLAAVFVRRHPRAAEAVSSLPEATVLIDAADLPRGLLLRVGPEGLRLRLCDVPATTADATVRGRFAALLDLAEGRIDGDALFFRRDLGIAGDTALVVALRNALDGEEIDVLAELDAVAGPLGRLGPMARRHATRIADALGGLQGALLAPVIGRVGALERRLARMESRMKAGER